MNSVDNPYTLHLPLDDLHSQTSIACLQPIDSQKTSEPCSAATKQRLAPVTPPDSFLKFKVKYLREFRINIYTLFLKSIPYTILFYREKQVPSQGFAKVPATI